MSIDTQDCLIEIGTEELPPQVLNTLSLAFLKEVTTQLSEAKLSFSNAKPFATPRRLAILITALQVEQATVEVVRKGPSLKAAFDQDGNPLQAALGFAHSCGIPLEKLEKKQGCLYFKNIQAGQSTDALLAPILQTALSRLPIPKRMRWADRDHHFVRPVHWVTVHFGDKTITGEVMGHAPIAYTFGHRFHHPDPVSFSAPVAYEETLQKTGCVIADFETRKHLIKTQAEQIAKHQQGQAVIKETLLEEVTGLVEWPNVLLGSFDKAFLTIPKEALISAMEGHQKCFPVEDPKTHTLLPFFILVSNMAIKDTHTIVQGNERVMRARLADAAFHVKEDHKIPFKDRVDTLKCVVFEAALGSVLDKTIRISHLAQHIAKITHADPQQAERAARLAKADLLTNMVGEFPDLQGIMGYYYALSDKEPESIAVALKEHYLPRSANDELPQSPLGIVLALADRIDTLVGIFGIGKAPTGDKDPFGLRRQALAVLKILVEHKIDCDFPLLIKTAFASFPTNSLEKTTENQVLEFCFERFKAWYRAENLNPTIYEAVLATHPTSPFDFHQRAHAVNAFLRLPQAEALATANKRVRNLLSKSNMNLSGYRFNPNRLEANEEKILFSELENHTKIIAPLMQAKAYQKALTCLADLQAPVDAFFDNVMVHCEDATLKINRLLLLKKLHQLFFQIADVSRLSL